MFIATDTPRADGDKGDPPAVRVLLPGSKSSVSLADLVKDVPKDVLDTKEKAKDSLVYICEGIPPLPERSSCLSKRASLWN